MQDFADMNYVDVIVKASLSLDSAPKNMLLKNKDTQVSWDNDGMILSWNYKQVFIKVMTHFCCVCVCLC